MTKRVHLLGSRIHELHAAVDPTNLPPAFGGTLDEPFDRCVQDLEAQEKAVSLLLLELHATRVVLR
jgi:hypothetical protein